MIEGRCNASHTTVPNLADHAAKDPKTAVAWVPDSELGKEDILLLHIALCVRGLLLGHSIDLDVASEGQLGACWHLARQCIQQRGLATSRRTHQGQKPACHTALSGFVTDLLTDLCRFVNQMQASLPVKGDQVSTVLFICQARMRMLNRASNGPAKAAGQPVMVLS